MTQTESGNTVICYYGNCISIRLGNQYLTIEKVVRFNTTQKLPFCCHDVALFYSRDFKKQHGVRWALLSNLLQQQTSPGHAFGRGTS